MRKSPERRGLIFSFLIVYLAIVFLLAGLVTVGFHLYRSQVSRSEAGLQVGIVAVEIGPLVVRAYQRQDSEAVKQLMRSFFAFPAIHCVHLFEGGKVVLSWPERGCPEHMQAGIIKVPMPVEDTGFVIEFGLDNAYDKEQNWVSTRTFGVLSVFVILLVAVTFTLLLIRLVMRPLMHLQQAMLISTPDNPVDAKDVNAHQLGGAGLIYNQMAATARRYYSKMEKTQKQLRDSQARFRDMAEISTDWFYELDRNFKLAYVSDQFFQLTGLNKKEVVGKTLASLTLDQDEQGKWDDHQEKLMRNTEFRQFEFRIRTGDGRDCVANISGKPVFSDKGKFSGYRGTGRDVTQFRQNQEALAEANQNFGDSVAYASHFQHRLLAKEQDLRPDFGKVRFIWQPRDLVGGDFLTYFSIGETPYIAFYDCTGHGVPGGFMVMLVSAAIDRIRTQATAPKNCSEILQNIHDEICDALDITPYQNATDGLDCAIICLSRDKKYIEYAGANIDLLAVSKSGTLARYPAMRQSLGYQYLDKALAAERHKIPLDGQCFVLATDGIVTQIGGMPARMMGSRYFEALLREAKSNDPKKLANSLMRGLRRWQGSEERRDDVMVLAFCPEEELSDRNIDQA